MLNDLTDETRIARAEYSIDSAIDDYERYLFDSALYELDNAKNYLEGMEKDCRKKSELKALLNTYYPLVINRVENQYSLVAEDCLYFF